MRNLISEMEALVSDEMIQKIAARDDVVAKILAAKKARAEDRPAIEVLDVMLHAWQSNIPFIHFSPNKEMMLRAKSAFKKRLQRNGCQVTDLVVEGNDVIFETAEMAPGHRHPLVFIQEPTSFDPDTYKEMMAVGGKSNGRTPVIISYF